MLLHLHLQSTGIIQMEPKKFQLCTCAHVWQAFVKQCVHTIAEESGIDAEFDDGLNIKEVTAQAFSFLGEDGIIRASENHACDECTQKCRDTSDVVFNNSAAVVGVDATDDDIPPLEAAPEKMEIDAADEMDTDVVVLDGIVMGPQLNNFRFFLLRLFVLVFAGPVYRTENIHRTELD
jgi:hypothetical protein